MPQAFSSSADIPARACIRHPQNQTRLTCTQCEAPICPDCMVMCEVGFKCPSCIGQIKSHITDVSPSQYAIAIILTFMASQVFGWMHPILLGIPFLNFFGIPILGLLLSYAIGQGMGKGAHWLSGRKLNRKLVLILGVVFIIGLYFGPVGTLATDAFVFLWQSANTAESLVAVGSSSTLFIISVIIQLLVPYCFWRGYRTPFMRP